MTVDSRATAISYSHFGDVGARRRILTVGVEPWSGDNDLEFVKADDESFGLDLSAGGDCWLIDAASSDANLLARIDRSGLPFLAVVGDADIDAGFGSALIDGADGHVLPGDSSVVVAALVARASGGGSGLRVADLSDGAARTMQALSVEASRIAERLAILAAAETAAPSAVRGIDAALVRRIIKLRRDRERYLPGEILADPAWDILLDLTAARLEGKAVPVSSLCIAAAVPTTTALRWIRSLTEAGLLQRRLDRQDGRRSHVELADTAADAMLAYLRAFNDAFAVR